MKKWDWNIAHWNGKQKLMTFFVLWVVIALLCWFFIPAWRDLSGSLLILLGAVAVGVIGFLANLVAYLKEPDHTTTGTVIGGSVTAGTFIARDQWNIYLSAAGRGRLSEEDFQKILNNYLVWVGNTNNKARLWGLESRRSPETARCAACPTCLCLSRSAVSPHPGEMRWKNSLDSPPMGWNGTKPISGWLKSGSTKARILICKPC